MVLTGWLINGVIAFAPVLAMLGTLRALDSFKLVRLNLIFWMLLWGGCSAVASYGASILVLTNLPMDFTVYSRYLAPLIEETLKAPGLLIAAAIHSAFNHFFFMPLVSALVVFWMVPFFMVWIFNKSTQALNEWLEEDFEGDAVLMEQLDSNEFSQTHVGQFLSDLRARCDPMTIVDIFCYIRLYTELSMRAKGLIIMREQGVEPPLPPGLAGQFVELRHLETALGKTAILSLGPLLQSNRRDLWHLKELESEARTTKF